MKILLMGDASAYHATLADALTAKGHHVTLMSARSGWLRTRADIDISRKKGRLGGAWLQLRLNTSLRRYLRGYDVVQICDTSFVYLRQQRQLALLDRLRRDNGIVALCSLCNNPQVIANLAGDHPALDYSEWISPWGRSKESEAEVWTSPRMLDFGLKVLDKCDGITTALYDYQRVWTRGYPSLGKPIVYTGIPIDLPSSSIMCKHSTDTEPLKMLLAVWRGREACKGVDLLLPIVRWIQSIRPGAIDLLTPENVPYDQFKLTLAHADIVIDQLYSYTPATTALLAMANGAVAITGGEADYLNAIGHDATMLTPIFNPDPRDMTDTAHRLLALIDNRPLLRAMQQCGPEFVRRHNSSDLVADRTLAAWQSMMQ